MTLGDIMTSKQWQKGIGVTWSLFYSALSRERVLRIPSVSFKATNWDGVSESPYKKVNFGPVSVLGRAR